MRVSEKWLKELVNVDDSIENIAEKMVSAGNEYESINKICPCTNLVVGRVVSVSPHPDSDHLHVCEVDLGDKIYQIVCGAPNVEANKKVIVAKIGANLPSGVIKQTTIRGVESNGMLCSFAELGLESKYIKESDKLGIHILNDDAPVGVDALEYLDFNDSYIDFELTANRSDLLSMRGMAYEVGAIYSKNINMPVNEIKESKEKIDDFIQIDNMSNNCYAYKTRMVKNVVIKESPEFIKSRLMASGIRPINNVVDISNYVMLLYGEPLHFFDYDKLGNRIIIREAHDKEKMTTLDNIERTLKKTDIVICDENYPVAIAGVMGGLNTEVTNDTKTILIEAAIFNPYNIRYTSKEILRSEASIRFEKGIDPNILDTALDASTYLLQKYADGEVVSGIKGFNDKDLLNKEITVTTLQINNVLGMKISTLEIGNIFIRLGFTYKEKDDKFVVSIPTRRLDINIKEDLIEEVGRIYGYNNMAGTLPISEVKKGTLLPFYKYIKNIKSRLSELGLNEVITYSLTSNKDIKLFTNEDFNAIRLTSPLNEDRSIMRYSLIPSLIEVSNYNIARGIKDINIYEYSKVYYKDDEYKEINKLSFLMTGNYIDNSWNGKLKVDFYLIKGVLENIFDYLGLLNRYKLMVDNIPGEYHPGMSAKIIIDDIIIGNIGRVHPNINKNEIYACELDLDKMYDIHIKNIKYKEIIKYPSIIKDVAFILDNNINSIDIIKQITKKGGKIVSSVDVFDVFKMQNGKKSLAFKIIFNDLSKTLTDEEVNKSLNNIIDTITKDFNAILRDK